LKIITLLPLFLSLSLLKRTEDGLGLLFLLAESPEKHFKKICSKIDNSKWIKIRLVSRTSNHEWVPFCQIKSTVISRRHYRLDIVGYLYDTEIVFFTTTKKF